MIWLVKNWLVLSHDLYFGRCDKYTYSALLCLGLAFQKNIHFFKQGLAREYTTT